LAVRAGTVTHDSLLQASRRVDWRFLLPEPDLGRVACIGVADPDLLHSLRFFSSELTALEPGSANGQASSQDVVVLRNPGLGELQTARRLLHPGGWLYIEVERAMRRRGTGASPTAHGQARALRKLGFVDVEASMHWPDFASCGAIVPLDDPVAVRYALTRAGRRSRAPLILRLAPMLAATRQLGLFVPCASALGRRPAGAGGDVR
jgi:hypothetical protein